MTSGRLQAGSEETESGYSPAGVHPIIYQSLQVLLLAFLTSYQSSRFIPPSKFPTPHPTIPKPISWFAIEQRNGQFYLTTSANGNRWIRGIVVLKNQPRSFVSLVVYARSSLSDVVLYEADVEPYRSDRNLQKLRTAIAKQEVTQSAGSTTRFGSIQRYFAVAVPQDSPPVVELLVRFLSSHPFETECWYDVVRLYKDALQAVREVCPREYHLCARSSTS